MIRNATIIGVRSKMIGVLLRGARLRAGKTLKDCAELLGCSSHTMSQYEHGRKGISLPEMELLASFFDVPVNDFWEEESTVPKESADLPPADKLIPLRQKMIGVLLRSTRLNAGKTLRDCAELLGCSPHTISQYEYGRKGISLAELELLASFFGVPVSYYWEEDSSIEEEGADLPPAEKLIPLRQKMIGVLLRQARREAGKTQKECAEALDVSTDTISKYEYGRKPIPFPQLELLVSLLEIPLSHLLDREMTTSRVSTFKGSSELLSAEDAWASLPPQLQEFIRSPDSLPYLQMALRLYELPKDSLKHLGQVIMSMEK